MNKVIFWNIIEKATISHGSTIREGIKKVQN